MSLHNGFSHVNASLITEIKNDKTIEWRHNNLWYTFIKHVQKYAKILKIFEFQCFRSDWILSIMILKRRIILSGSVPELHIKPTVPSPKTFLLPTVIVNSFLIPVGPKLRTMPYGQQHFDVIFSMSSNMKQLDVRRSLYRPFNPNFRTASLGLNVTMKQGSEVITIIFNHLIKCMFP